MALKDSRCWPFGRHCATAWVLVALAAGSATIALPQVVENAGDPFQYAIPYPRTRLVHATDSEWVGATAHLRAREPFLLYQLGRDLTQIQFKLAHGAYGQAAALTVPLYVSSPVQQLVHGAPARFARDHSASCAMCHSSVYREPAGGQTLASTGGLGRNTTHFFGAGLVEMIGEQIRAGILAEFDANGNGLIDRAEVAESRPVRIRPHPDAAPIDYGDLAPGPDGVPRLGTEFRLWFVDSEGQVLPDAFGLDDPRVAAYGFVHQPFGWGRGRLRVGNRWVSQGGESATVREFFSVAADFHMGVQAFDPTQQGMELSKLGHGGLARVSLNGAQQFDFGGSVDAGLQRLATGLSLDDPDRDGHRTELSEGDMDAVEFYLLHAPEPAVRATGRSEEGRALLAQVGCTRCHVESWRIEARNEARGLAGDRRYFHLATFTWTDPQGVPQVGARLVRSHKTLPSGDLVPAGGEYVVERIYSDFKHWDIGPAFHERRWDGSLQTEHRTAPLWGVGSTGPYGHSGTFMTLADVISAHGGAASRERDAYVALPQEGRDLIEGYLHNLVLYSTDEIPCDLDGDGTVSPAFQVAGQDVGYERFDARFLFVRPPKYRKILDVVRPNGWQAPLAEITNVAEAYGLDQPYRLDADRDGFPDVMSPPKQGESDASDRP